MKIKLIDIIMNEYCSDILSISTVVVHRIQHSVTLSFNPREGYREDRYLTIALFEKPILSFKETLLIHSNC